MTQHYALTPAAGGTPAAKTGPGYIRFRERVRLRLGGADLLVFRVGEERFAVEVKAVEEVLERPEVGEVRDPPQGLIGLFSHRGLLLPLYSPEALLGPVSDTGSVVLVMRSGPRLVGLAVDDADDIVSVQLADLRTAPATVNAGDIVAGLTWHDRQLIAVLDARTLIGSCTAPSLAPA